MGLMRRTSAEPRRGLPGISQKQAARGWRCSQVPQLGFNALQVVQQDSAVAELLLEFQGINVRKPQLRRGPAGIPLHDGLERGELGGHTGRGQENVVFRAVVKPGELPPQGPAHGLGFGRSARDRPIGLRRWRVETISPVCCQKARKAVVPASLVTTPCMPRDASTLACSPLVRSMKPAHRRAARSDGNGRQGRLVADLPRQFAAPRRG